MCVVEPNQNRTPKIRGKGRLRFGAPQRTQYQPTTKVSQGSVRQKHLPRGLIRRESDSGKFRRVAERSHFGPGGISSGRGRRLAQSSGLVNQAPWRLTFFPPPRQAAGGLTYMLTRRRRQVRAPDATTTGIYTFLCTTIAAACAVGKMIISAICTCAGRVAAQTIASAMSSPLSGWYP